MPQFDTQFRRYLQNYGGDTTRQDPYLLMFSLLSLNTLHSGENMAFNVIIFVTGFIAVTASFPNIIACSINRVLVLTLLQDDYWFPVCGVKRHTIRDYYAEKQKTRRVDGHDYSWFPHDCTISSTIMF
jgi:hypothetical protein